MITEQSLYRYLRESLGDAKVNKLVYFGRNISAKELLLAINQTAAYLQSIGIKKGDVVGIALPNIPQAIFALYAINAVGGVANLIHPKTSKAAFCAIIEKTHTKAIFLYDKLYKKRKDCLTNIATIVCSLSQYMPYPLKSLFALTEPVSASGAVRFCDILCGPVAGLDEADPAAPAVYIHSGGTMGEPKTVMLSSVALNNLAENLINTVYTKGEPLTQDDVMLMMLPIFHGYGLGVCVHTVLSRAQTALLPRFQPALANKMIKKYGVTLLAGVPAMFAKMLKESNFAGEHLKTISKIFCGGDRLDPKIKTEFDALLKQFGSKAELTEGYGLTEAGAVFAVSLSGETRTGCQGKPLVGNAIKVLDENNNELAAGDIGEFFITTPSLMLGYLNDSKTTAAVLQKDDTNKVWLKTGDTGYLDEDGAIHFVERSKRSIKIAAINIFPSAIEAAVCLLPEIKECCCIRAEYNGKPCTKLLVVLADKMRLDAALEKRIKTVILDNLIKYALPKEIYAVQQLARTSFGKIDFLLYEKMGGPIK